MKTTVLSLILFIAGGIIYPVYADAPEKLTAKIDWPVKFTLVGLPGHIEFFGSVSGGVPPYSYKWDFGPQTRQILKEDPGIVIFKKPGTYNVTYHVEDSKGNTAFDTATVCYDNTEPEVKVQSPLPGQVTGDLSKTLIKGSIDIRNDKGMKYLQTQGVPPKDIQFKVIAHIKTGDPMRHYFSPVTVLDKASMENNSFTIQIEEKIAIPEEVEDSFKIEPMVIDPAGNGIIVYFLNSLTHKTNTKVLVSLMNSPPEHRIGTSPYEVMAFINYKYPLLGLPWLLKNYDSFNIYGKTNFIRSMRFCDIEEAYLLLMMFAKDKTVVPDKKAAELLGEKHTDLRICDHAYNALHCALFITKKQGSAPRIFPTTSIEHRDKMIGSMVTNWEKSKEFFLLKKELVSTKKINVFEMVLKFEEKLKKEEE
jgi:hypothetical protein